jgi:hypothetical protein
VREAFGELQSGKTYGRFSAQLGGKLAGGSGVKFVASLGPYGPPSAAIFKGVRGEGKDVWYDYLLRFGLGVSLPFAVRLDAAGSVAGLSVG